MVKAIEEVWPHHQQVDAIGVASPGPLDPHTGYLLATPNIRQLDNFPLAPKLSDHFGVPAFLDNDANLACLGEWKYGAAKGHHDVLYLTISTGIGGGVIVNDRLLQGYHGLAAELGIRSLILTVHPAPVASTATSNFFHQGRNSQVCTQGSGIRYKVEFEA